MILTEFFSNDSAYCVFCKRRKSRREFAFADKTSGACLKCDKRLTLYPAGTHTNIHSTNFTVSAPFSYNGILRSAFLEFKFHGCRNYSPVFCHYMNSILEFINSETDFMSDFDYITAIPLSASRMRERSYNQAALLAEGISQHFNIPFCPEALFRKRDVKKQSTLNALQRAKNIKGAFGSDSSIVSGKRILLIDDIFTTGATAFEAIHTLKNSGAEYVGVCVLAMERPFIRSQEYSYLMR